MAQAVWARFPDVQNVALQNLDPAANGPRRHVLIRELLVLAAARERQFLFALVWTTPIFARRYTLNITYLVGIMRGWFKRV